MLIFGVVEAVVAGMAVLALAVGRINGISAESNLAMWWLICLALLAWSAAWFSAVAICILRNIGRGTMVDFAAWSALGFAISAVYFDLAAKERASYAA